MSLRLTHSCLLPKVLLLRYYIYCTPTPCLALHMCSVETPWMFDGVLVHGDVTVQRVTMHAKKNENGNA